MRTVLFAVFTGLVAAACGVDDGSGMSDGPPASKAAPPAADVNAPPPEISGSSNGNDGYWPPWLHCPGPACDPFADPRQNVVNPPDSRTADSPETDSQPATEQAPAPRIRARNRAR